MKELTEFNKKKKAIGLKIKKSEDIGNSLSEVITAAINLRRVLVSGKIGKTVTNGDDIIYATLKHTYLNPDTLEQTKLVDIFMSHTLLPAFAEDPMKFFPPKANIAMVYIFGLADDFAEHVAPFALKLEEKDIRSISYFGLDEGEYSYVDPIDFAWYLINVASIPENINILKKNSRDGSLYDFTSRSQIRGLKKLVSLT